MLKLTPSPSFAVRLEGFSRIAGALTTTLSFAAFEVTLPAVLLAKTVAALARLGRLGEAETLINSLPAAARNAPDTVESDRMAQIAIHSAKADYAQVITHASEFGRESPEPASRLEFSRAAATAALLANKPLLAQAADSQWPKHQLINSQYWLAQKQLIQAEEGLANSVPAMSRELVQNASVYFTEHHLWRSQSMALTVKARAFSLQHDEVSKARAEHQATETLARLQ